MGVEYMDRACRATLNFFTETLRGTHPAPADIMDLLMRYGSRRPADGPRALRGLFSGRTPSLWGL